MDVEMQDLVSQLRTVKGLLSQLEAQLRSGVDKPAFLGGITDAQDGLKRLRALVIYHSRAHQAGIRDDGRPDLRFNRNRLGVPASRPDLRRPLA